MIKNSYIYVSSGDITSSGSIIQPSYYLYAVAGMLTNSGSITGLQNTVFGGSNGIVNTGTISGNGGLNGSLSGAGIVEAIGGTLDVTSNITATNVTGLEVANASNATLQFDSSVAAGDVVTFLGRAGTVALSSSTILGNELGGFAGTIAGLQVDSGMRPSDTNAVDLLNIPKSSVTSASVSGTTLTVNTTGGSFNLTLGSAPATGTGVGGLSDGNSGSDLFLAAPNTNFLVAQGIIDSWLDPASWAVGVPSTAPAAGSNFNIDNNAYAAHSPDYVYLPATLQQATGTGTSTWTIDDSNGSGPPFVSTPAPFLSALSLVNQGSIFVNGTNNLTAGSATTNCTLTGQTVNTGGSQFFENDGVVNVVGTSGGGSTTANFTGNLAITGTGTINLFGNAALVIGSGVGVSSGQTIDFTPANGNTNGSVTEVTAPIDHATIAGFLPGDTLTLEGLGTDATPTLNVILKNGEAAVRVMEGALIVDQVTFLGNFTTSTLGAPGGFTATNASSSINGGEITIGVTAPLALGFTSEMLTGDDGQLTLTGTISDGINTSAITIFDGTTALGPATINGANWTFATTLSQGTHQLSAKAVDQAGNTATVSAPQPLTVNDVATAPILSGPPSVKWTKGTASVSLPISVAGGDADDLATTTVTIKGLTSGATITDSLDGKTFSASTVTLTAAEVNSGLTLHPGRLTSGTLTATASMTEAGGSATSAPLTISLSDPPVHHQSLGSRIHQHAANLDLIEQLHTHLAKHDLLLYDPHGHDESNTLALWSPRMRDAPLLAAATHKMIEAMASFEANPAGMMSPLVSSHEPTISEHLAIGSPGHHGG
jgi:hypothetical protein